MVVYTRFRAHTAITNWCVVMYERLYQAGEKGYSGVIREEDQGRRPSDATEGHDREYNGCVLMLRQMRVRDLERGRGIPEAGALALNPVLEQGIAARIDGRLQEMAGHGEAD